MRVVTKEVIVSVCFVDEDKTYRRVDQLLPYEAKNIRILYEIEEKEPEHRESSI